MAKLFVLHPPTTGGGVILPTLYAEADGCVIYIPWSADVNASLGGWETSSGSASAGYSFTTFDSLINTQLGYGAASIAVSLMAVAPGGSNTYTPNYVFTTGWATSISSPTGQLYTASGPNYLGAGTIPLNTCAQGVDPTAFPVTFQSPFVTAWKSAVAAAINHMKGASYASKIAYVRVGGAIESEWLPPVATALETQCSPANLSGLLTAWTGYMSAVEAEIVAQGTGLKFDQAINGGPDVPFNFADAEAAIAVSNGFGIGDQGLENADITAFANHGSTSGGANYNGWPSNDFIYNFTLGGAAFYELQTLGVSDPSYVGTPPQGKMGSLVPLLPFAIQRGATHIEVYFQDWLIAYDPSDVNYATYGAAYASAIQGARIGTPTNPIGIVTGTFNHPNGQPVNGIAQFSLSGDGVAVSTACIAPITVRFPVIGGTLSCSVVFNDQIQPFPSSYQISVKDGNGLGGQVWGGNYQLIGGTANLNTLVPM
jgi:hypothetical protein